MTRLVNELDPARLGRRIRILNCLGLRAAESIARSKKVPLGPDPANWSTPPRQARRARPATATRPATSAVTARPGIEHGRRAVDRWLPIFWWDEPKVWAEIIASGLPWHPAYDWGSARLSCVFCVLAPRDQLILAARHEPELAREYVRVERIVGHTFKAGLSMAEVCTAAGVDLPPLDPAEPDRPNSPAGAVEESSSRTAPTTTSPLQGARA